MSIAFHRGHYARLWLCNMSGSVWRILLYGQIISSWQGTALLWSLSDL